MKSTCEDCRRCDTCPNGVCIHYGTNTCTHGMSVCDECRPGNCAECAEEVAAA